MHYYIPQSGVFLRFTFTILCELSAHPTRTKIRRPWCRTTWSCSTWCDTRLPSRPSIWVPFNQKSLVFFSVFGGGGQGDTKPGGVGILTIKHYKDVVSNFVMYVMVMSLCKVWCSMLRIFVTYMFLFVWGSFCIIYDMTVGRMSRTTAHESCFFVGHLGVMVILSLMAHGWKFFHLRGINQTLKNHTYYLGCSNDGSHESVKKSEVFRCDSCFLWKNPTVVWLF